MTSDAIRFLNALAAGLPPEERMILCGFEGDPDKADVSAWRPRPWKPGDDLPWGRKANGYVTVASFGRAKDTSFRRRRETFAAGRALMVDDVGTKVSRDVVANLAPSAIIETSPNNFQYWYFLDAPERDQSRFDGVIKAFIAGKLLGADPGMSGVTRVGRIPGFTNGKTKHNGWITVLTELNPHRYSIAHLLAAFNLEIAGKAAPPRAIPKDIALERVRHFDRTYEWLKANGMLKRPSPDAGGWTEIICPWVDGHTNAANTGAGVREPAPENQYFGSFKCHHGSCIDRGLRELTDFIGEHHVERLEKINEEAPATLAALLKRRAKGRKKK